MKGTIRVRSPVPMCSTVLVSPAVGDRSGRPTGIGVSGIVGVKKFSYDIWGDTMNNASRMECSGEVGQVNISVATCAFVKDVHGSNFASRGHVQAKGKGEMAMFFAHRSNEGAWKNVMVRVPGTG